MNDFLLEKRIKALRKGNLYNSIYLLTFLPLYTLSLVWGGNIFGFPIYILMLFLYIFTLRNNSYNNICPLKVLGRFGIANFFRASKKIYRKTYTKMVILVSSYPILMIGGTIITIIQHLKK